MKTRLPILAVLAAALAGCGRMDSRALAEKVCAEMQRDLAKGSFEDLKVEGVTLVEQGGNRYAGSATAQVKGVPIRYRVTCDYDGRSFCWNAEPDVSDAMVLAKLKAREAKDAVAKAWPGVKEDAKAAAGKAADAVGKVADVAADAADKTVDAAGKAIGSIKDMLLGEK